MSVMKKLILGAAGLASVVMTSAAVAGGPDVPPPPSDNGVYIEGHVGYARVNWAGVYRPVGLFNLNNRGGVTFGFDVGYH